MEWDGKVRGQGTTNVEVPQRSPLSPVIFLIYMAPILEDMEEKLAQETGFGGRIIDIELPSFVDDIIASFIDWDGTRDMKAVLEKSKYIVAEVAYSWDLPLEKSKTETLVLKRKRRRRATNYVRWLGIILDETLTFDIYWKNRIEKARKLLRAFNSIGNS